MAGFDLKTVPIITDPEDITADAILFGAPSQTAASPVVFKAQSFQGAPGPTGATGAPGQGVPAGGTTGQILAKNSNTDYDTEWVDDAGTGTTIMDATTVTPNADDFIPLIVDGSTTATPGKVEATYFASAAALTSGLAAKQDTITLSASQLFGRGATGGVGAITLGTNLSMSGSTLNATGGGVVPNAYTDPTQTVGPTIASEFYHFLPGFKFTSNIGTYGVFTEAGSSFSSTAYGGGTTLDAQTGVMSVRTAASATLQRPTFSLIEERVSALAGNGLTIGMAALVKFRPAAASNAPSATNDYWVSVGFQGANSNRIDSTAQLKFDYYWTGSAVAFEASSREGGGSVTTTALTLPTADVYTLLSVECNGFSVTFRVNGVSVATRTMTVAASQLRPQILINQTTAANVNGIDVDWATYYVKGLSR